MTNLAADDGTIVYLLSGFNEQTEKVKLVFAEEKLTTKLLTEGMGSKK